MEPTNQNDSMQQQGRVNPADNLTQDDRVRGGRRSAAQQTRDSSGRFAGRKGTTPRERTDGERERNQQSQQPQQPQHSGW